ncbi:MAG: anti-sigma F factor [Lachnospiraceae bacterium]
MIHGYSDYSRKNKEKKYGLLKENDSRENDDRENCNRENVTRENHNTDNNGREKGERDNHNENENRMVHMECFRCQNELYVLIEDTGIGIDDVKQAMEPLFTSKPDMERSGMGFAFMEAFMDELYVESQKDVGTKVYMSKRIGEK